MNELSYYQLIVSVNLIDKYECYLIECDLSGRRHFLLHHNKGQ